MDISYAKAQDMEDVKKLWQYCFTDDDEYVNYYFDKVYDNKNNLVLKDENSNILSSLMTNPYNIRLNNRTYRTSYIVGVSSFPENRARGYTSLLMKKMLNHCEENQEKVSMLMPIDTKIYTRYGYANVNHMMSLDIPLSRLSTYKDEKVIIKRQKEREYIDDMIKIYSRYAESLDIFFERDRAYMEKFLDETYLEGGEVFLCFEYDKPCAYMTFYPKYEKGKSGFIREIIANSISSARSLLSVVSSHYTQIENVLIDIDENSNIRYMFSDDNHIKYSLRPFMMSRILNAEAVLRDMDIKEDINIKISDSIIEKNNFVFSSNPDKNYKKIDISIDIYDLARLIYSAEEPEKLIFRKDIKTDGETLEKLKKIFTKKKSYFNDYV